MRWAKLTQIRFKFAKGATVGTPMEHIPIWVNREHVIFVIPTDYGSLVQTVGVVGSSTASPTNLHYSVKEIPEVVLSGLTVRDPKDPHTSLRGMFG